MAVNLIHEPERRAVETFIVERSRVRAEIEDEMKLIVVEVQRFIMDGETFTAAERDEALARITTYLSHQTVGNQYDEIGELFTLPPLFRQLKSYIRYPDSGRKLKRRIQAMYTNECMTELEQRRFEEWDTQFNNSRLITEEMIGILGSVQRLTDETDIFPEEIRDEAFDKITALLTSNEHPIQLSNQPGRLFELPAIYQQLKYCLSLDDNGEQIKRRIKSLYEGDCRTVAARARYDDWNRLYTQEHGRPPPVYDNPNWQGYRSRFNAGPNWNFGGNNDEQTDMSSRRNLFVDIWRKTVTWIGSLIVSIPKSLNKVDISTGLDEAMKFFGTNLGQFLAAIGVSVTMCGFVALYNLWCFQTGRKTAINAKKSTIDNCSALLVGNAVGAGVALGVSVLFGPPGWAVMGTGILVGLLASALTRYGVGKWTSKYYKLDQIEQRDNALKLLGVTNKATGEELRKRCKELSRLNHPDYLSRQDPKPTDEELKVAVEKFLEIRKAYQIIKTMREAEEAAKDQSESLSWKESLLRFMHNLILIRNREAEAEPLELAYSTPGFDFVATLENTDISSSEVPNIGLTQRERCECELTLTEKWVQYVKELLAKMN